MIRIDQLKLPCDYKKEDIPLAILERTGLHEESLLEWDILRESIDARKKRGRGSGRDVYYVLSVSAGLKDEDKFLKSNRDKSINKYEPKLYKFPYIKPDRVIKRPVIVGCGPAGLFCGLSLARAGYSPLVLERGNDVRKRMEDVRLFWEKGIFKENSNVQFGEGGAGTFSDGKLNTQNKDKYGIHRKVLEDFVLAGAPSDILYKQKPHLGTDVLSRVVENLREEIKRHGGEVRFSSLVSDFLLDDKRSISGVLINGMETVETNCLVLAIGHSARDSYEKLHDLGLDIEQKPFAIGLRAQHSQDMINTWQYGEKSSLMPPADYSLRFKASSGRSVYSFCMCPGGYVVNASSQEGHLVVNGMSYRGRHSEYANSAIVCSVGPKDFKSEHPLAGVYFQQKWERLAHEIGKAKIPLQYLGDFREGVLRYTQDDAGRYHKGKVSFANLRDCLPEYVSLSIIEAMEDFGRKIKGFNHDSVMLSGVETRTSAPIRILRDDSFQSNVRGIFPCGEGAGYAGGITSSAIDGIRVAEAVAKYINEMVMI